MRPSEKDLVRVQSESELRAGMFVWLKDCTVCGRSHFELLLRVATEPGIQCGRGRHWESTGGCTSHSPLCPGFTISQGRLYRLKDEDDSREQTREKQQERVE